MQSLQYATARPQRLPRNELMLSFLAIVGITGVYLLVVLLVGIPGASDLFGHTLGIMGFTLMLATEILYTLRKRIGTSAWGRPSHWLKFHIFTGIVGPYLVFLHSAWDFGGLAGLTMLLTAIVVLSGFVGRYIYTFLPRTAEGVLLEESEIASRPPSRSFRRILKSVIRRPGRAPGRPRSTGSTDGSANWSGRSPHWRPPAGCSHCGTPCTSHLAWRCSP